MKSMKFHSDKMGEAAIDINTEPSNKREWSCFLS